MFDLPLLVISLSCPNICKRMPQHLRTMPKHPRRHPCSMPDHLQNFPNHLRNLPKRGGPYCGTTRYIIGRVGKHAAAEATDHAVRPLTGCPFRLPPNWFAVPVPQDCPLRLVGVRAWRGRSGKGVVGSCRYRKRSYWSDGLMHGWSGWRVRVMRFGGHSSTTRSHTIRYICIPVTAVVGTYENNERK
jgi:hypothetical protein